MLNVYITLIDTITISSTSCFNTVYNDFNRMNIGCKYKAKELKNVNFVDLYYMYYYV